MTMMDEDTPSIGAPAHTPGPWYAEKSSAGCWYVTTSPDPFGPVIGQTWPNVASPAEEEANARMFAAAATMYAALKLARAICHDAFKDTCMEWDAQSMAVIDAALQHDQGDTT